MLALTDLSSFIKVFCEWEEREGRKRDENFVSLCGTRAGEVCDQGH